MLKKHVITWIWVKGHIGHIENERCDKIARKSAQHPLFKDEFYENILYNKSMEK